MAHRIFAWFPSIDRSVSSFWVRAGTRSMRIAGKQGLQQTLEG